MFKIIVLGIMVIVFIYDMFISYLNYRSMKNPIPENVKDVYDEDTYKKWREYHTEKTRLSFIVSSVSFVISIVAMSINAYALLAKAFPDTVFMGMFAVTLLSLLMGLFTLPFEYYEVMHIEEKYGFNRSTKKTFFIDKVKGFLIGLFAMTMIGLLFITVHEKFGDWLILAMAIALTVIALFVAFLYPLLSKIFNKFTPLEDGELKDKLTELLQKNGYKVRGVFVMDASRRSTKMNAYFSGFGKMKTIVLYDTLKDAMSVDEICAVFAHEMGHGIHKDTLKNQILTFFEMLIMSTLAYFTVQKPEIFTQFGFTGINYGFAIILILSVEFAIIAPLLGMFMSYRSRVAEYRADAQAVKEGYGPALISALKVLARGNYSNLSPDPIIVKLQYSHPTLTDRVSAIEEKEKAEKINEY